MLLSVLSQLCLKRKKLKFLYNILCRTEVHSRFSKQLLYSNLVKNVHMKRSGAGGTSLVVKTAPPMQGARV